MKNSSTATRFGTLSLHNGRWFYQANGFNEALPIGLSRIFMSDLQVRNIVRNAKAAR